jgi:hypothetical protein
MLHPTTQNPSLRGKTMSKDIETMIRRRCVLQARASLLPLQGTEPLVHILSPASELNGTMICGQGGRHDVPFSLERIADSPPTFRLAVPDLPRDWTPLAVFVGRYAFWEFEPVTAHFSVGKVLPKSPPWRRGMAAGGRMPGKVAADLGKLAAHSGELAADAWFIRADDLGDPAVPVPVLKAETDTLSATYTYAPKDRVLEIEAEIPEGSDGEICVAELRQRDEATVCRAVSLGYQLPNGRYKGVAHGFWPANAQEDFDLTIRPLTENDLALLKPKQVQRFLAEQDFFSMPVEQADGGLTFAARWQVQKELIEDPKSCWALDIVRESEA